MPSSPTTRNRLIKQAAGENLNAWGTLLNSGLIEILDAALDGWTTKALTGDVSLTSANYTADEARSRVLKFTGTGSYSVTIPSVEKVYIVWNALSGNLTITTGAGATAVLPTGAITLVICDGANVKPFGYGGFELKTYIDQAILATTGSLPATTGNEGKSLLVSGGAWVPTLLTLAAISDFGSAYNFTTKQTFSGSSSVLAALFSNSSEKVTISATAATGTINYDIATQSVLYYTSNAAANWTVNLRHSSGTSLDSALSTGQSVTVAFAVTQGATPYYNSSVQVDGTTSGVTTKWQNVAPTAGIASTVNVYTYTIIKTGSATFTVLASVSSFV